MKISAIIPAYNNKNHLRNLLKSLENQTKKPDYRSILVIKKMPSMNNMLSCWIRIKSSENMDEEISKEIEGIKK